VAVGGGGWREWKKKDGLTSLLEGEREDRRSAFHISATKGSKGILLSSFEDVEQREDRSNPLLLRKEGGRKVLLVSERSKD